MANPVYRINQEANIGKIFDITLGIATLNRTNANVPYIDIYGTTKKGDLDVPTKVTVFLNNPHAEEFTTDIVLSNWDDFRATATPEQTVANINDHKGKTFKVRIDENKWVDVATMTERVGTKIVFI